MERITRFVTGGGLPAFALPLLVFYQGLLVALLFTPPAATGLGAFAEDFRLWCFGYDPSTGNLRWGPVVAMLLPPLVLGVAFLVFWWKQLGEMAMRPMTLIRPAALAASLVIAAAFVFSLLGGSSPQAGDLSFPADALRTSFKPPEISLTSHTGEPVDLARLKGKVVLVTAVYASCPHTCPLILTQAKKAIAELDPTERRDLHVIGVTIDPSNDSPEVLAELAEMHDLTPPLYNLVTGDTAEVERVLDDLGVARQYNEETGQIDHANLFVLVDRSGRIAYRFSLGENQQRWLVSGLRVLLHEPGNLG